jgi:hypothetical protein
MQKTIPEGNLFNGGNSFADLLGSDAEVAAFFRTSKGYRYALMDTMSDLVECFGGSLALSRFCVIPLRKRRAISERISSRFLPEKNSRKKPPRPSKPTRDFFLGNERRWHIGKDFEDIGN